MGMRIVCDNAHHDAGQGVCTFCVQGRIDKAISDYRIAALQSVLHDEMLHDIVKSALDSAEKERRRI